MAVDGEWYCETWVGGKKRESGAILPLSNFSSLSSHAQTVNDGLAHSAPKMDVPLQETIQQHQ